MITTGQQLGDVEFKVPSVPSFAYGRRVGNQLSALGRSGNSGGEKATHAPTVLTDSAALAGAWNVLGQRFVQPGARTRYVECPANQQPTISRDFGSRSFTVAIDSMVRQFLNKNHVQTARRLIDAVPSDQAFDQALRRLRIVLAEPVVRRKMQVRARHSGDIDWLRKNARDYVGKWVAVADGTLLGADESLSRLQRSLRQLAPGTKPVLHRL